jgi:uncharacterized protein YqeY
MIIRERIQKKIAEAMRSKEALRLDGTVEWRRPSKQKEIVRVREVLDAEIFQVIHTLMGQRNDSVGPSTKVVDLI